jgi:hypothetical protein
VVVLPDASATKSTTALLAEPRRSPRMTPKRRMNADKPNCLVSWRERLERLEKHAHCRIRVGPRLVGTDDADKPCVLVSWRDGPERQKTNAMPYRRDPRFFPRDPRRAVLFREQVVAVAVHCLASKPLQ